MFWTSLFGLATFFVSLVVIQVLRFLWRRATSPLHKLPGPASTSWLYGNVREFTEAGQAVLWDHWTEIYGNTFKFWTFFNTPALYTTDTNAMGYILSHQDEFVKPADIKMALTLLGEGLVFAEGQMHKKQRRVMNPAFGPAQIRSLIPTFNDKALQMCELWQSQIHDSPSDGVTTDVLTAMNRVTLDIVGLAGFGYNFDALESREDDLSSAFDAIMKTDNSPAQSTIIPLIGSIAPWIISVPFGVNNTRHRAKAIMDKMGMEIIQERKQILIEEGATGVKGAAGKDLLTLLIRANVHDKDGGMSDEAVLAQIPTFLIAGHETTSAALTWTLFGLSANLEAQRQLREELLTLNTDSPTMEDLKSLKYLDMVVREALRLWSPISSSKRVALKNVLLPLRDGRVVKLTKGDEVRIPIHPMNTAKDIWGEDAAEFNPDRWKYPSEAAMDTPGIWGNQMTFMGGSRACIGFQFAVYEIKAVLYALVRRFEFSLTMPAGDVTWSNIPAIRKAYIKGCEDKGPHMPLRIKPYVEA
ncbi:cytochrome P450 [Thelephora ganbajun]|uniref:Cytochrome P450 n=1 Tax=Thelephora ganbajun TaxID=370292 RepID=A0ACB6Z3D9_THEGA|nr:cytochrome P450 [Thelephora ganbajun]